MHGWENNYFCGLCIRNLETGLHLFVECPLSRAVWEQVAVWSGCDNLLLASWGDVTDVEDWFRCMIHSGNKKGHTLAILTLWWLWNQRNAAVFENKTSTAVQALARIKDEARLWANAGAKALRPLFVDINNHE